MMPIRWMSWEAVIRVSRRQKLCLYFYNFFVGSVWVQKWRLVIRRDPLGDPDLRTRAALRTAEWQGGGWEPPGDRGHEEHGGGPAPALQLPQGRVRAHAGVLGNTHRGQAGLSSKYTQQYLTFINKCYYRKYHSFFWGKTLYIWNKIVTTFIANIYCLLVYRFSSDIYQLGIQLEEDIEMACSTIKCFMFILISVFWIVI